MTRHLLRQRRHVPPRPVREEAGAVAMFTVLITLALVAMAGLVIDGGYTFAARVQAHGQADQAARIGADALTDTSLRNGTPAVDPARGQAAAVGYLRSVGATGTVTVTGRTVTVTVTSRQRMRLLSAVGVNTLTVTETASAESVGGVTEVEDR
jgi:Flp pilus assembly protein TadG